MLVVADEDRKGSAADEGSPGRCGAAVRRVRRYEMIADRGEDSRPGFRGGDVNVSGARVAAALTELRRLTLVDGERRRGCVGDERKDRH